MRAVALDYQCTTRRLPPLGIAVLAAALLALALMAGRYRELDERIGTWEARLGQGERLARASAPRSPSKEAARQQALEVQHANDALRQLTVPWGALFRAVESAGGKSVALLAMQPDVRQGTVAISGEAKDLPALLDYVRRLGTRDVFSSVHLHHHQVQQQDPERPIRFSLRAVWKVTT
jgi:Tfp pilus assembly protein PilN